MEPSPHPPEERGRALARAAWVAVAVALFLRLFLLPHKHFWNDEAAVALIARGALAEIASPLSTAPPGFVLAVKLCSAIPGLPPEVAYRLPLLAAGMALLLLLPRLARALGASRESALAALILAAGIPPLVHYSRELKHYGLDALVAAAFPLAALRVFPLRGGGDPPAAGRAQRALPALLAAAAPWLAYGSVFPVGATLAWGWVRALRIRDRGRAACWAAATAAFLCSLALLHLLVLRRQAGNPSLLGFWEGWTRHLQEMNPLLALGESILRALRISLAHLFGEFRIAGGVLAAAGLLLWPREGRSTLATLAGTALVAACAAAIAGKYVVSMGRFLLFAAPLLVVMAAEGLARLAGLAAGRAAPRLARAAPIALAAALCGLWSWQAVVQRTHPERATWPTAFRFDHPIDAPELIATAEARRAPGEPVLVSPRVSLPFLFYAGGRLGGATLAKPFPPDGAPRHRSFRSLTVAWLRGVPERGWILLSASESPQHLRTKVGGAGFTVARRWRTRGGVLFEVVRERRP